MPVFDLIFRDSLHLGVFRGNQREDVLEWIPSDSFFAALVTTWLRLGLPVEERIQSSQPLLVTSLFPRAGSVRFYPAPPFLPDYARPSGVSSKALKRIRWLSQGVFDQIRQKQAPDPALGLLLHGRTLWVTVPEAAEITPLLQDNRLWSTQVVPHVTVDRTSQASNLFHTGRMVFAPGCGLWFAAREHPEWVREALPFLADAGLGGMRSTGHGAFTWSEQALDLPLPDKGSGVCLSRYAPASEDEVHLALQNEHSAYRLTTVGGWCQDESGRAWRRRTVRMVEEGALLPSQVRGALVDVRPQEVEGWAGSLHPVIRSGLAFLVPAGALGEEL